MGKLGDEFLIDSISKNPHFNQSRVRPTRVEFVVNRAKSRIVRSIVAPNIDVNAKDRSDCHVNKHKDEFK